VECCSRRASRRELRAMNKLTATTRIGREVPRVRRERYPDDERSQHCDDSGEHRPIIRLNSGASNSPVTVRSPTVCCAQIIQHRKLGMEFIHFSDSSSDSCSVDLGSTTPRSWWILHAGADGGTQWSQAVTIARSPHLERAGNLPARAFFCSDAFIRLTNTLSNSKGED
jgi:hypothetical protein